MSNDLITQAFSSVKAWKTVCGVLFAMVVFLLYFNISQIRNTPVVLIPYDLAANSGRMQVSVSGEIKDTNLEYLANVAFADLGLIMNFTPDNVISQHQRFLNRLTESLYGKSREKLLAEADEYKRRAVSQSFYPTSIKMTPDNKRVEVSGTQIRWMGGKETLRTNVTYVMEYESYKGYFHLADLRPKSELKDNRNTNVENSGN